MINEFPGKLRNLTQASPHCPKLFELRKESKDLDPDNAKIFHRLVAQLLYISKRSRPDLAPSVPFLTTRVCKPSEDDWKKLRMVIEYLKDVWTAIVFYLLFLEFIVPPPQIRTHDRVSIFIIECTSQF